MDQETFLRHRLRNLLQSTLVLGAMALLCGYLAWVLGGEGLAWLVVGVLLLGYWFNPSLSPWLILRLYGGRPLAFVDAPQHYRLVQVLAERAGLPRVPTLYYLPSDVMNAFTTGTPETAVIALSDGLLRRLGLREIAGVLAHEVSHIRHRDLRLMGFADLMGRVTSALSFLGQVLLVVNLPLLLFGGVHLAWTPILLLVAAPALSGLAQLALSRSREYDADLGAAELTGDPEALASALSRMEWYQGRMLGPLLFPGQRLPEPSLLRTHPPVAERVRRLLELRDRPRWGQRFPSWLALDRANDSLGCLSTRPLAPRWHRTGLWY